MAKKVQPPAPAARGKLFDVFNAVNALRDARAALSLVKNGGSLALVKNGGYDHSEYQHDGEVQMSEPMRVRMVAMFEAEAVTQEDRLHELGFEPDEALSDYEAYTASMKGK